MIVTKFIYHKKDTLSRFIYNFDEFQSKMLTFMSHNCLNQGDFHWVKVIGIRHLFVFMLMVLGFNNAQTMLSATTAQTIKGTEPYFTLNGVPLTNTSELLGFTYTDASGTTSAKATADAAVDGTIIIVDPNMKMSDIKAIVPINNKSTALSSLLGGDLNIIDADDDTTGGINAIGTMKAYWTKDTVEGYSPANNEKFDACSSYKLTIAITDATSGVIASTQGNIEALTTYGDPDKQQYAYPATAGTIPVPIYAATYIIEPKFVTPNACWAKPNLYLGSDMFQNVAYTDWDEFKGFKGVPTMSGGKTFPTTGFYVAWFNLTVAGKTAANIITKMDVSASGSPLTGHVTSGDIKLRLVETSSNVINVTLFGPRDGTVTTQNEARAPTRAFTPTTFTLKDSSGANVYTFTIEKWFITKNVDIEFSSNATSWTGVTTSNLFGWNGTAYETPKYCANLGGTDSNYYKVPVRSDYTNSDDAFLAAWNGSAGTGGSSYQTNHYTRAIGSLFAEWGFVIQRNGNKGYPLSEFDNDRYWTSEPYDEDHQYIISQDTGAVYGVEPFPDVTYRAACVSP